MIIASSTNHALEERVINIVKRTKATGRGLDSIAEIARERIAEDCCSSLDKVNDLIKRIWNIR